MTGPDRPATIAAVVTRLDEVVEVCRAEGSPNGYFAALYRRVTIEVARGIDAGVFDDGPRMARLDVAFANRYLDAWEARRRGAAVTRAWALAFDAADDWWPVVVQHLLLGMNAHINLDLGIAAARVAPGPALAPMKADFDRINAILASLVDDVGECLSDIWPALRILDWSAGRLDEGLINFSITRARDHAWAVARRLSRVEPARQEPEIAVLDVGVEAIGRGVRHPGWWTSTKLRAVRVGERGSVRDKIDVLAAAAR